jgi:predicted ATPase
LHRLLADARERRPRLVLLEGEAGIGKTRLVIEFVREARQRGARVLASTCIDSEGAPALQPWIDVVRAAYFEPPEGRGAPSLSASVTAELAKLVPEIGAASSSHFELEASAARFRLFDAVAQLLRRRSARRPLIAWIDDLHWADRSALALLAFVAQAAADAKLLLVGTHRPVPPEHALATYLAGRVRAERLALGGLTESEVGECVATARHGHAVRTEMVRDIHRRTGGNPFFVVEIARHIPEHGVTPLPRTVVEMLRNRLSALPAEAGRALQIAAVLGEAFDVEVVREMCECVRSAPEGGGGASRPQEPVGHLFRPAVLDHLIAPVDAGGAQQYRFVHTLVRKAVYATIEPADAGGLHRCAGEVLAARFAADLAPVLPELAWHFGQAGDAPSTVRAIRYARRAAEQALQRLAFEEAVTLDERAVELVRREAAQGRQPLAATGVLGLRLHLGWALESSGNRAAAKRVYREVADTARQLRAATLQGQATLGLAGWLALTSTETGSMTAALQDAVRAWGRRTACCGPVCWRG